MVPVSDGQGAFTTTEKSGKKRGKIMTSVIFRSESFSSRKMTFQNMKNIFPVSSQLSWTNWRRRCHSSRVPSCFEHGISLSRRRETQRKVRLSRSLLSPFFPETDQREGTPSTWWWNLSRSASATCTHLCCFYDQRKWNIPRYQNRHNELLIIIKNAGLSINLATNSLQLQRESKYREAHNSVTMLNKSVNRHKSPR